MFSGLSKYFLVLRGRSLFSARARSFFVSVQSIAVVALGFFSILYPERALGERLRIVVGSPDFRPYTLAAPPVLSKGGSSLETTLATEISKVLESSIDLTRSLQLVPPSSYILQKNDNYLAPIYLDWFNIGASGLIRGRVEIVDKDTLAVDWHFFDISQQKELLARKCLSAVNDKTTCVWKFLDEVVAILTGEPGIFSSRLAVVKKVPETKFKAIYSSDIEGKDLTLHTNLNSLNLLPAFDNLGKYLFFTSYMHENPDLYRLELKTKQLTVVSSKRGLNMGAVMSPNGKKIALCLSIDGNTEIYVMDANGRNLQRLTDSFGQDVSPTWSPDGTRIAFVSSRSGQPHIYVMQADGTQVKRLTFKGTYNQEPDWSPRPDGQIAFTGRDEYYRYDIFLVHPDTGVITRLTQDEGSNESPSFSPDGHQIVFTSTRIDGQTKRVFIMDSDGSRVREVPLPSGAYETPVWGPRTGYR